MRKKIPALLLIVLALPVCGQITLNSNNFPVGGLRVNRGYCLAAATVVGNPGSNQIYNFTGITPVYHDTIKYFPASQTPWASFHPGATVASAVSANGLITVDYYTAGAAAFIRTGQTLIGDLGGGYDTIHASFASGDTLISNNYAYGYVHSSRATATYVNFLLFANLERTTIRSFMFDGWGSLQTPINFYGDVLRMKGAEVNLDSAFYFGSLVYAAADTQYYYKYFAKDVRHPVVIAHTDKHFNLQYLEYIFSPPLIAGCMDTMAQNYNPLATESDGNCIYCNVSFTITPDTGICSGSTIDLNVSGGTGYLWNDGSTAPNLSVTPAHSSTYSVYVSSTPGCHALASVQVTVNEPVIASFWTAQDAYHAGEGVQFINLSENANQYSWDFDDPPTGTSSQQFPWYTFTNQGTKDIVLIASNSCFSDSAVAQITITEPSAVGRNVAENTLRIYPNPGTDYFMMDGFSDDTREYELSIFDLTGRLCYKGARRQEADAAVYTYDISSLPGGMYIIEVSTWNTVARTRWFKIK